MNETPNGFEQAVENNWSLGVMEATHRYQDMRSLVIEALHSLNAECRSAAVAVMNEANDAEAHDLVFALAHDPAAHVREEVLEYLEQFPSKSDASLLLDQLISGQHPFLASSALIKLCGGIGELITEEDTDELPEKIRAWKKLLRTQGLVA